MRPDPPAPDTPNEGRRRVYSPLVEPYEPEKLQRRDLSLLGAAAGVVGGAFVVLVQIVVGLLT